MKFISLLLLFLLSTFSSVAQEKKQEENAIPSVVDSLYREDQFYVGLSFNLISNKPNSFSQNGFSGGVHIGFIRDMPINKRRNLAIGVGLGVSTNTYNSNLFIDETPSGSTTFSIIEDNTNVDRNRFNTNLLEMPIQLRWRTSTPTNYSFWRIYTGVKLSYIYNYKAIFKNAERSSILTDIPELNRLRYAATLTVGNGSFNAFVQYDLITLFDKDALIDNQRVDLQPIKFGVEFYML
ncbi:porin family protein [Nonlabens sp.]|uniref:porin family protein n=1 Tax=Nonlabens sp. TaxID=1888209 RepID=UPI001BD10904|nr:porin family protein [Nonlabens sp.]